MDEKLFAYGGYHFLPVGGLMMGNNSFQRSMHHCQSAFSMGMCTYEWKKCDYSYDSFYGASTKKDNDLFLCIETGLVYLPAMNELFIYTERKKVLSILKKYGALRTSLLERMPE